MKKKAQLQVGGYPAELLAFPLLILVIFAAILLFGFKSCTMKDSTDVAVKTVFAESDANFILTSYLQVPVVFQGRKITMYDLVAYSYLNKDYKALTEETRKYLLPAVSQSKFCMEIDMNPVSSLTTPVIIFSNAYDSYCPKLVSVKTKGDKIDIPDKFPRAELILPMPNNQLILMRLLSR